MIKFFMYYCNQKTIQESGIYRYRFKTKKLDAFFFKHVTNIFIPSLDDSDVWNETQKNLEAIFLVKTEDNTYYFNFFMLKPNRPEIKEFENWLESKKIEYEVYVENHLNTELYQEAIDVNLTGIADEVYQDKVCSSAEFAHNLPRYSYWRWIHDILKSKVDIYYLFESRRIEKTIPMTREYLKPLINLPNFYYMYFEYINLLRKDRELSLKEENEMYNRLNDALRNFQKYWDHVPHEKSYLPINYCGIVEGSLRYNFDVWFVNIDFEKTTSDLLLELFSKKLKMPGVEFWVTFKPLNQKKSKIIIITNNINNNIKNELQELLVVYDKTVEIEELEKVHYNFEIESRDDPKTHCTDIKINSLVCGLFTKNIEYWQKMYFTIGTELYEHDWIIMTIHDDDKPGLYYYSKEDRELIKSTWLYMLFV